MMGEPDVERVNERAEKAMSGPWTFDGASASAELRETAAPLRPMDRFPGLPRLALSLHNLRQFRGNEPELHDRQYDRYEMIQPFRLSDVCVRVQLVRLETVLLGFGGTQYHHRDTPQFGALLYLSQYLATVVAWKVQVNQDEVWR